MQPRVDPIRPGWTSASLMDLITNSNLHVSAGCELLDRGLNVVEDFSKLFVGGTISRGNNNTIHGTCDVTMEKELDWGTALIRPYVLLSNPGAGAGKARFNSGVYLTSTPDYQAGTSPRTFGIQGYDQLQILNTSAGDTYVVTTGTSYLSAVATILAAQGFSQYVIDQSRASTLLSLNRSWPVDTSGNTTWLSIINDLLSAVGYRGLWADWNGVMRAEPYAAPSARASEWFYDANVSDTILVGRARSQDYFNAPNRWVAVRTNLGDGVVPVEGNGVFTYVNQNDGKTSVAARSRTITKTMGIEAADQTALVTTAFITINADQRIDQVFNISTGMNPLHWHFDRVSLSDSEFGAGVELQEDSWSMPLNGDPMTHSWKTV